MQLSRMLLGFSRVYFITGMSGSQALMVLYERVSEPSSVEVHLGTAATAAIADIISEICGMKPTCEHRRRVEHFPVSLQAWAAALHPVPACIVWL